MPFAGVPVPQFRKGNGGAMNRNHAEHILDAYIELYFNAKHEIAANDLREIILDAMTSYRAVTYPNITYTPSDATQPYTTKPIVTC